MSSMGMIVKEYDNKVKLGERQAPVKVVKVKNNGNTELRKVIPNKPYTYPLKSSELSKVKNQLEV